MKKLITLAFCFMMAVSVLTGCGNKNTSTTDTTTKPSSIATEPSTTNSIPTTNTTLPSTIPDSGSMPSNDGISSDSNTNGSNGMDSDFKNRSDRSSTHAPSIVGRSR